MSPLWLLWGATAGFIVIAVLSWRLFTYFRDPKKLRRFQNMSLFSGITNIPFIMVAHGGHRSEYLLKRHRETGAGALRIGPQHISYSDPRAIKYIYGHGTKCAKDDSYVVTAGTHFHLADVVDKADHARKRKILSSAYALKNLEEWEYKVADKVERLIAQFDKRCTAPLKDQRIPHPQDLNVNYRAWTNFFAIEAIADIGLSEKLGFLDRGDDMCDALNTDGTRFKAPFRDSLYISNEKTSWLVHSYGWYKFFDRLTPYMWGTYKRAAKASRNWDGIHLARSQARLDAYRRGERYDDFFQAMLEDKAGKPNNMQWGEMDAEINIMLNAGSTTTAIAVTNVMYHLLKHPEILAKLREEVDRALDPDEIIAPYDSVKNLPYLRACLDESLRIVSPTTHNLGRVTPPEGLQIMDEYIPGGVSVSIAAYIIHQDPAIYPEPEKYIPERWLGEGSKKLQPYFLAFSAGARGCIGRNISYLEQTVLIASLVHRYEFALPSPDWELERLETMNMLVGDMWLKVWRRDIPGLEKEVAA
ncbi:hypothetical protein H2198_006381 [Neophaeococcomyces mojaviensis]|uniref:Uncharacterized protein n=1 Tax=Neophaeococcomyces mojaviensis TaxID=3383035 RepID=A0ACC3A3H3_9EURO|nr:hypothetical protein H2198_006381 [Knufia sp. JES_112]